MEWLGDTQEDLEQQFHELDQHSGNISISLESDDGMSNPFTTDNRSERSEPLFTAARQAWITHQISSQLNELSDELFYKTDVKLVEINSKLNKTESKLEEAEKLISSQTAKILLHETRISDLISAKDKLTKEVANLKLEITSTGKQSPQLPAERQNSSIQPSQSSLQKESVPLTSHNQLEDPSLPQPARPSQWAENWSSTKQKPNPSAQPTNMNNNPKSAKQKRIEEIFNKGNRTVGIKPISRRRVQQFETDPDIAHLPEKERFEKAKVKAVHDFLEKEMLMEDDTIKSLPIQRIFFPRNVETKILYVQFTNSKATALITSKSNLLQPNYEHPSLTPSIIKYIPTELYQCYKALEGYAYELRNNPTNPLSTNIRYGTDDFELRVRTAKNNAEYDPDFKPDPWQYIQTTPLPDLPAINLDKDRQPAIQPPGRRLVPSPPPSPLPVPQDILEMDDPMTEEQQSSPPNMDQRKRKEPIRDEQIFKKPLPQRHSKFPTALNTERFLQSTSSSNTVQIQTPSADNQEAQQCQ